VSYNGIGVLVLVKNFDVFSLLDRVLCQGNSRAIHEVSK
jgi:hypothetical protein